MQSAACWARADRRKRRVRCCRWRCSCCSRTAASRASSTSSGRAATPTRRQSWQSTGQNIPVSGSALQEVLGSGAIGQIAQQLGMSHGETAGGLAQVLPQLIDQFTPNGEVPDNQDDIVAQALAMLSQKQTG